jgi:hypothetical protein
MLKYAIIFAVISLVAGLLGFGGVAAQRQPLHPLRRAAGPAEAVSYKAEVEVHTPPPHGGLRETPVSQVPDEIFPYLLATRYCESDLLCGEVVRLFGDLPPGYRRVRAIEEVDPRQHRLQAGQHLLDDHRAAGVRAEAPACAATSRTWASPSAAR